jgi:hypothetical protein
LDAFSPAIVNRNRHAILPEDARHLSGRFWTLKARLFLSIPKIEESFTEDLNEITIQVSSVSASISE